ncbi:Retinoic acid induced 16-like protein-domain-containing protein [Lipomyces japonicus]|uniref:Retinoic acid induced 16-like protein-domain-containing protein n=1 Tax=Lipomyces japonicus TaxID=56871 RepID=UPI0034CDD77E
MSFWGLWRRSAPESNDGSSTNATTNRIERAWVALAKEENKLRKSPKNLTARNKVAKHIVDIAELIKTEEDSPGCTKRVNLHYALDHGVFTKIAEICRKTGIIKESVTAFAILFRSTEDDLMSNQQVIQSVNFFLAALDRVRGDRVLEQEFVEMLFAVAARLRSEPDSLTKWILSNPVDLIDSDYDDEYDYDDDESLGMPEAPQVSMYYTESLGSLSDDEDIPNATYHLPPEEEITAADGSLTSSFISFADPDSASRPKLTTPPPLPQSLLAFEEESSDDDLDDTDDKIDHAVDSNKAVIINADNNFHIDEINSKPDFPLFYFLMGFIHDEGRAGEFARTGILYLVECALSSSQFEQWVLGSDFGTLMASGLGAMYSQLSRTMLRAFEAAKHEPKIVTMAKESERKFVPVPIGQVNEADGDGSSNGGVSNDGVTNKDHLRAFLSYLEFWQDVMTHCGSQEICRALVRDFEQLFLNQLLVPSLQAIISNGNATIGAEVAVLTYLSAIFDTLEQDDLIDVVVNALMKTRPVHGEDYVTLEQLQRPADSSSRATTTQELSEASNDEFSLARLLVKSLGSSSEQTVIAGVRLISSLVRNHYSHVVNTIFKVDQVNSSNGRFESLRTPFTVYNWELEFLTALLVDDSGNSGEIKSQKYDSYLRDARVAVESHRLLPVNADVTVTNRLFKHRISSNDEIWHGLLRLLARFFANSVELNLVVTKVMVELMSCGWLDLRAWMLTDLDNVEITRGKPAYDEDDEDGDEDEDEDVAQVELLDEYADDRSEDEYWGTAATDRTVNVRVTEIGNGMRVLAQLASKVDGYRNKIPGFDEKLAERRQLLNDNDDEHDDHDDDHENDDDRKIKENDKGSKDKLDMNAVAFSSPVVTGKRDGGGQADQDHSSGWHKYTFSPADTQQRAEKLFMSSPSLSSNPSTPSQTPRRLPYGSSGGYHHGRSKSVMMAVGSIMSPTRRGDGDGVSRARSSLGHRRARSTMAISSPFTTTKKMRHQSSRESLRAFASLMTAPVQEENAGGLVDNGTGTGIYGGTNSSTNMMSVNRQASFGSSRLSSPDKDVFRQRGAALLASSPSEFANALNEDGRDDENNDNATERATSTAAQAAAQVGLPPPLPPLSSLSPPTVDGARSDGMATEHEMDDIVTEPGYAPAIVQVSGFKDDDDDDDDDDDEHHHRRRYVSVGHLLSNVVVFDALVQETRALVQARGAAGVDVVDYGG